MQTRLFHTIVIVGASLGAAATSTIAIGCSGGSGSDGSSVASDTGAKDTFPSIFDVAKETFPGISPVFDSGLDSGHDSAKGDAKDADATDTFPGIAIDSGKDTFPGISPKADTFPGISPPPPPPDPGAG